MAHDMKKRLKCKELYKIDGMDLKYIQQEENVSFFCLLDWHADKDSIFDGAWGELAGAYDAIKITKVDTTINNGGATDYYSLNPEWTTHQDVIEAREMNYAQGNIYKVACTFNVGRHEGTNYERELNEIIFFANRELKRVSSGT